MKTRLLLAAAASVVLLPLGAGVANAATQAPSHPCVVTATLLPDTSPLQVSIADVGTDCIAPQVTVQEWLAPSADGRPLAEQQLWATGYDGILQPGAPTLVTLQGGDNTHNSCFMQIDVAYGHARDDLLTPYGSDLIDAWHTGTQNCFWSPPSESPPATTEPPVVTTAPPASSPPVTTTAPPVVTVTPSPTVLVTLVPPKVVHKPTPPAVTHKPKPRPTSSHKPVPRPSASGCIASGCDTPTPAPTTSVPVKPTLPYTGARVGPMLTAAGALILGGVGSLLALRLPRRHTH